MATSTVIRSFQFLNKGDNLSDILLKNRICSRGGSREGRGGGGLQILSFRIETFFFFFFRREAKQF